MKGSYSTVRFRIARYHVRLLASVLTIKDNLVRPRRVLPLPRHRVSGGLHRDGPASDENRSHWCRPRILSYFGVDPPKRGSVSWGIKLVILRDVSSKLASKPDVRILYEKGIELKLPGNEIYYTNALILLVKNMLCCKHHCQKGFNLIIFILESEGWWLITVATPSISNPHPQTSAT